MVGTLSTGHARNNQPVNHQECNRECIKVKTRGGQVPITPSYLCIGGDEGFEGFLGCELVGNGGGTTYSKFNKDSAV